MNHYAVVFTLEAEEQVAELYHYIKGKASADTALRYATAIIDYCESLKDFPHRGTQRDDIRALGKPECHHERRRRCQRRATRPRATARRVRAVAR